MTVAFFISGHGFGHASRQVEIINALAAARPGLDIVIRSAVDAGLLARTLRTPADLRPGPCDSGIVQSSSVAHDDDATTRATQEFYGTYASRVEAEVAALRDKPPAVIVGDIPPLAFDVAARLGIPSIAIANFTWDWIYETHPGLDRDAPVLETIRAGYRKATLALELPLSAGFEVFPAVEPLPLVARRSTRTRAEARAHFGVPADRPMALLSFGGYGLPTLNLAALDCLDEWTVVTTDRVSSTDTAPSAVVTLAEERFRDSGFRYEDLVAAADVVVTKPGYGIIAECVAANVAMVYTSRGDFREYDLLVSRMPRYLRARFLPPDDLFAGRWLAALNEVGRQPAPPEGLPPDGAEVAAARIASMAEGVRPSRRTSRASSS